MRTMIFLQDLFGKLPIIMNALMMTEAWDGNQEDLGEKTLLKVRICCGL